MDFQQLLPLVSMSDHSANSGTTHSTKIDRFRMVQAKALCFVSQPTLSRVGGRFGRIICSYLPVVTRNLCKRGMLPRLLPQQPPRMPLSVRPNTHTQV